MAFLLGVWKFVAAHRSSHWLEIPLIQSNGYQRNSTNFIRHFSRAKSIMLPLPRPKAIHYLVWASIWNISNDKCTDRTEMVSENADRAEKVKTYRKRDPCFLHPWSHAGLRRSLFDIWIQAWSPRGLHVCRSIILTVLVFHDPV